MAEVSYRKTQRGAELVTVAKTEDLRFGESLYLRVSPGGAKNWTLRYSHGGKRKKMRLGSMPGVTLAAARAAALVAKAMLAEDVDPAAQRREDKAEEAHEATTFGQVARMSFGKIRRFGNPTSTGTGGGGISKWIARRSLTSL
ncbi:Putative prophage CPS-53 integrase [Falsiruegeria litorea R37]|uniref:Putative prophage CPS-53 integrase n=1 Tax=Falsiruegeria litorea R37 TaxID=1200284 RepID=A0A1Y5RKS2_9RHOB|nr:Arm DNA-binding domain-containing protein [Falsiruegeria litorea]SLN19812.1 Putative prophage CPS-53 integrase [Falsiruegeria litorea R37]